MKEARILRLGRPNLQTKPARHTQPAPSTQAPFPRSGFVLRPLLPSLAVRFFQKNHAKTIDCI
jgi:hypothetical protein